MNSENEFKVNNLVSISTLILSFFIIITIIVCIIFGYGLLKNLYFIVLTTLSIYIIICLIGIYLYFIFGKLGDNDWIPKRYFIHYPNIYVNIHKRNIIIHKDDIIKIVINNNFKIIRIFLKKNMIIEKLNKVNEYSVMRFPLKNKSLRDNYNEKQSIIIRFNNEDISDISKFQVSLK